MLASVPLVKPRWCLTASCFLSQSAQPRCRCLRHIAEACERDVSETASKAELHEGRLGQAGGQVGERAIRLWRIQQRIIRHSPIIVWRWIATSEQHEREDNWRRQCQAGETAAPKLACASNFSTSCAMAVGMLTKRCSCWKLRVHGQFW